MWKSNSTRNLAHEEFHLPLLEVSPVLWTSDQLVAETSTWQHTTAGSSPDEIVGSNPTGGMDICLLWGLCDELTTRPEESYRLWFVVCDLETSRIGAPYIYIYIYDISSLRVKHRQLLGIIIIIIIILR